MKLCLPLNLFLKGFGPLHCLINYFLLDRKPVVECSFITEFEDHIFVTVDAEAFFFLHDLITSYVKEKERVVSMLCVHLKMLFYIGS